MDRSVVETVLLFVRFSCFNVSKPSILTQIEKKEPSKRNRRDDTEPRIKRRISSPLSVHSVRPRSYSCGTTVWFYLNQHPERREKKKKKNQKKRRRRKQESETKLWPPSPPLPVLVVQPRPLIRIGCPRGRYNNCGPCPAIKNVWIVRP